MSKVAKQQRTPFPDATVKRLVELSVNGPTFQKKEELKRPWTEEFNAVEGADSLKRISQIEFSPAALKNLKKSVKGCDNKLKKLSNSPTLADVRKICLDLTLSFDENEQIDSHIERATKYIESKRNTAMAEIEGMRSSQQAFLDAEKDYEKLKSTTFKEWRRQFSDYQKYLTNRLTLELRKLADANRGVKLTAEERKALTEKRVEMKRLSAESLSSTAAIQEYFTVVLQRSFTPDDAARYTRLFSSRQAVKVVGSEGYRVSSAGTVCARIAELVSAELISATARCWGASIAAGDNAELGPEFLARAEISSSVKPLLVSSTTYQNVVAGRGLTLPAHYKLALPHVKKIKKTSNKQCNKKLVEIIASIVCEVIAGVSMGAVRVLETGNGKTISAEHLKCVLGLLFGASEDLATYVAITDAAYSK